MNKRINKAVIKILSGIMITSSVATPLQVSAVSTANSTIEQQSVDTRATKTGTVNTSSLNVRSGAGTSYSKLGTLTKGKTVEIADTASNGWYKIKYGTGYGYVSNQYITVSTSSTPTPNPSPSETVIKTGTVNTSSLNVRSGAGTSYSKMGSLSKGTKVEITSSANGWYRIKFGTRYGYVSSQYITTGTTTTPTPNPTPNPSEPVIKTGTVTATSLNVRNGISTSSAKVGTLSKGSKVEIVAVASNGWYKIKYGTGYGYVSNEYVTTGTSTTPTPNPTPNPSEPVIKTGTVTATSLNVRNGISTSSAKVGTLSKGSKVEIVAVASNGWYKIKYGTGYGYVSNEYVTTGTSSNTPSSERTNLNNFLFVGDSFTYLLQNTIKAKNSNVYVHAKSGSTPGYWLDKVSSMPANSSVDGVVLLIGVNGASTTANKNDVKTLINKLSARYPNKKIYVQKVFPVGKNFTSATPSKFNASISTLNGIIESHCASVSNARFINTTSGFVDSNGYLINTYDGLHISSSYNNSFYNNILNAVKVAEKK